MTDADLRGVLAVVLATWALVPYGIAAAYIKERLPALEGAGVLGEWPTVEPGHAPKLPLHRVEAGTATMVARGDFDSIILGHRAGEVQGK
jgi:hypothetical protein